MKNKNIFFIILVVALIVFVMLIVNIFRSGFIKHNAKIDGTNDKIKYSKSVVSQDVINYLVSQKDLNIDLAGKKIAVYYVGDDSEISKDMVKVIDELKSKDEFKDIYFFHPETDIRSKFFTEQKEAIAYVEFNKLCENFCIVKPDKKELLSFYGMNEVKVNKVPQILKQFKDW